MSLEKRITKYIFVLLKPTIRLAVKYGVPYRSITYMIKWLYINEGKKESEDNKIKYTISSISSITGIPRNEAKKFNDQISPLIDNLYLNFNRSARTLEGWQTNPAYIDKYGNPKPLHLLNNQGSFKSLCSKYAGIVPFSLDISVRLFNFIEAKNKCNQVEILKRSLAIRLSNHFII